MGACEDLVWSMGLLGTPWGSVRLRGALWGSIAPTLISGGRGEYLLLVSVLLLFWGLPPFPESPLNLRGVS